jgi:dihydroorotate dehydrogenase (NAD+) catalytic subunit
MKSEPDLSVRLGGLALRNPVLTASGTFGFGEEYAPVMEVARLGGICTKGLSLQPRSGNPGPRLAETPAGMLNAIGLQNPGLERFARDILPRVRALGPAIVVNIFGSTVEEYETLAAHLDALSGIAALEVNISCPNVSCGGMAFGADPAVAAEVSRRVRAATRLPVLVKLSPNVTDIVAVARAVAATGVDGLTLINTLKGTAIDPLTGHFRLGNRFGGLSGPAIRPVAVRMVAEVRQALDIPIVGAGGIVTWEDALEFIWAGANAVQVGSATFREPGAAVGVLEGLARFCRDRGVARLQDLAGRATPADDISGMENEGPA